MIVRWPNSAEVNAVLRHVYTGVGVLVAILVYIGLNPDVAAKIAPAIHQIGDGASLIIAGISALIPVASAIYALLSSTPFARYLKMDKDPDVKQVIMVPGTEGARLADEIPGDKVAPEKKS